ncbi:MAG: hypothetical protein JNJ71_17220 [Rubrivivax sp.]|nr:hypothetical protein [Rubrivivax sp.]
MERCLDSSFDRRSLAAGWLLVCAGIAGCSGLGSPPLRAGDATAAVTARLGAPTERRALPAGGERLVYTRGPLGRGTTMVDLGADGRVLAAFEALSAERRAAVEPGMSAQRLREHLGPPAEQRRLALEGRQLWAWRFPTYDCLWFAVTLDAGGRVLDAGEMTDPICDVDHD